MKKSLAFLAVILLLRCSSQPNLAGTTDETMSGNPSAKGLYGKLVDVEGKAVHGAKVKAVSIVNGLFKVGNAVSEGGSETDSVSTDTGGYYIFESLSAGIYNLQGDYGNGQLVVFIKNIFYDSTGAIVEVKIDTLRAPGQVFGAVNTHTEDLGGVLCYIPGTSYLAITDDTGGFTLSNIPQGTYKITFRKDGLKTVSDTGMEVLSGERTILPIKNMEADPAYPPPTPAGLAVVYDTLNGCAVLKWNRVVVSDLAGYVIYRNDSSSTIPQIISKSSVIDTFYVDTVFSNLMDTSHLFFSYRVKAQDQDANLSTVYSKPITINAPSPTMVRTFFSWKFLNTKSDSASINDTVSFIVFYKNATRKNMKLSWYLGNSDSIVRTKIDSSLMEMDTFNYAWRSVSNPKIHVSMIDKANTVWRDSTIINIVQDNPVADAGQDTIVLINDKVRLHGSAKQQFGAIAEWAWDIGNMGTFQVASEGDTTIIAPSAENLNYLCVLRVTDDDGNSVKDTIKVNIRLKSKPVVNKVPNNDTMQWSDTMPGNNDTMVCPYSRSGSHVTTIAVSVFDTNRTITKIFWDVNNGTITHSDTTTLWECTALTQDILYYFKVWCMADDSVMSDTLMFYVLPHCPPPQISAINFQQGRLFWDGDGDPTMQYKVLLKKSGSDSIVANDELPGGCSAPQCYSIGFKPGNLYDNGDYFSLIFDYSLLVSQIAPSGSYWYKIYLKNSKGQITRCFGSPMFSF